MGWVLDFGPQQIKVKGRRVLGRQDFPSDFHLSRTHAEVTEDEDGVYIKDLNSSNGTFLRGRRLQSDVAMKLSEGDRLRIGQTDFTLHFEIEAEYSHLKSTRVTIAICPILIAGALIFRPSMDFGATLTVSLFFIGLAAVLVAVLAAAVFWNFLLSHRVWNGQLVLRYFGLVLLTGYLGALGILKAADWDGQLSDLLVTSKLEQFCVNDFNYAKCAMAYNTCPKCAQLMDRWKRLKMADQLEQGMRQPASPSKK